MSLCRTGVWAIEGRSGAQRLWVGLALKRLKESSYTVICSLAAFRSPQAMRRAIRTAPIILCLAPMCASGPIRPGEAPRVGRMLPSACALPSVPRGGRGPTRAAFSETHVAHPGESKSPPNPPSSSERASKQDNDERREASALAEARIGVGSGGVGMDLDVDVEKLKGALGKVAGPLVVFLNVVQSSIFYAAPMVALLQFVKELRKPRRPARHHDGRDYRIKNAYYRERTPMSSGAYGYSGGEVVELTPMLPAGGGEGRPDWMAFAKLLARVTAQFGVLVGILLAVGAFVEWESSSGGFLASRPLLIAVDLATAVWAIFLSENIRFLRSKMDMQWYLHILKKPTWTPPPIAFPLIWTPLKLMQSAAFVIVWQAVGHQALSAPILIFALHLVLGDLWNLVFFGEKRVGFGLSVIWAFYAALAASCYAFLTVSPTAGYLLMPTAVWVFIAVSLQFSIWLLNGQEPMFPITSDGGGRRRPIPEATPPLVLNL